MELGSNFIVPTAPTGANNYQAASTKFVQNSLAAGPPGGIYSNPVYFASGRPWADVRAWGAVGNQTTDDSAAFQSAINFLESTYAGGILFVPPGVYRLASGITTTGGVRIVGAGQAVSFLVARGSDVIVVTIGGGQGGIEDLTIFGKGLLADSTFGATQPALSVVGSANAFRDVTVGGGTNPLNVSGFDSYFENVTTDAPYGSAAVSNSGGNWFVRCKFDLTGSGVPPTNSAPYSPWAANTTYAAGNYVTLGAYNIVAVSVTGDAKSGSVSPALQNYGVNMVDNHVTWQIDGPSAVAAVALTAGADSENYFSQCDMSGRYSKSMNTVAAIRIGHASHDISSATFGVFTATGGGGTAIVTAATAITVTSTTDGANNTVMNVTANNTNTAQYSLAGFPTLYFRVGTAEGAAATADVAVIIVPWP